MTRSNGDSVRLTPGNWIALCSLILVLVGALVRLESRLATIEAKIQAMEQRTAPPALAHPAGAR